jgi:hypothetical protein
MDGAGTPPVTLDQLNLWAAVEHVELALTYLADVENGDAVRRELRDTAESLRGIYVLLGEPKTQYGRSRKGKSLRSIRNISR